MQRALLRSVAAARHVDVRPAAGSLQRAASPEEQKEAPGLDAAATMGTMKVDPHNVHHFWGLSAPLDLKYLTSAGRTLATALGGVQLNDAAASSAAPLKCLQVSAAPPSPLRMDPRSVL